jgi:tRNA-Thr(GGU) m(6)t(6)A37 methyltransferase TsaA
MAGQKQTGATMASDYDIRPGEVAVEIPENFDSGLYFIGQIHTPWKTRAECPKRGDPENGPVCRIEIDPLWRPALDGIDLHQQLQVLYWMDRARRDLVRQSPRSDGKTRGTFSLRSPVRPNPIASSVVTLVGVEGAEVLVRGLDCLDGTPLIDLKPVYCDHAN